MNTCTERHTGAPLPTAAEGLNQALASAVQGAVLKHLASADTLPAYARASIRIRTGRGFADYSILLKRQGGAS